MNKEKIREALSSFVYIPDDEWVYFSDRLHYKVFKKGEYLTHFGQVERHLFFLIDGIVMHTVNDSTLSVIDFAFPGQFFSSYSSFITQRQSDYAIEPITKTAVCYYITYQELQQVYANLACGEKIGRLAAERLFIKKTDRELTLHTLNAREKYQKLLATHPDYVLKVPLKLLASYLSITPETLSRVRKNNLVTV